MPLHPKPLSRRPFLQRGALVNAAATTGGVFARSGIAGAFPLGGYGPLVTDPGGTGAAPAAAALALCQCRVAGTGT